MVIHFGTYSNLKKAPKFNRFAVRTKINKLKIWKKGERRLQIHIYRFSKLTASFDTHGA